MAGREGIALDGGRERTLPLGIDPPLAAAAAPASIVRGRAVDWPNVVDAPKDERRTGPFEVTPASFFVDVDRRRPAVLDEADDDAVEADDEYPDARGSE